MSAYVKWDANAKFVPLAPVGLDLDQTLGKVTEDDCRFGEIASCAGAGADAGRARLFLRPAGEHGRTAGIDRARAAGAAAGSGHRVGCNDGRHRSEKVAPGRTGVRLPADRRADAPLRRLGGELYADPAGAGGAHAVARAGSVRSRALDGGHPAHGTGTRAADRCPSPRAGTGRRRSCLDAVRTGACGRRVVRRDRRLACARRVRADNDPASPGGGSARPDLCRTGADGGAERGRRRVAPERVGAKVRRDLARWRDRLGQDGGLFRGGRGCLGTGQAGADPVARNRADAGLSRPLSRSLRRQACAVAFRPAAEDARAGLAPGGGGPRAGGGRRSLGAVPAVQGAGADRRRRGARPRLQAGGSRFLQRPRHGDRARAYRWFSSSAGFGDAVGRKPRQRARRVATSASYCRRDMPTPRCPT